MITDAQITAVNRFLNVTNGREKLCRLVQYFARFYAFYLMRQGLNSQRWVDLKSHLAIGRKFFRLLKPVELAQASVKSLDIRDPVVKVASFIKFSSNFFYFTSETLSLIDSINFYKFQDIKKINEFGLKFWFFALIASIISSIYGLHQIQAREEKLNNDGKHEQQYKLIKEKQAITYQLVQDLVDTIIPIGGLKWLNLDERVIGLAGMITSAMAVKTQWKKTNP